MIPELEEKSGATITIHDADFLLEAPGDNKKKKLLSFNYLKSISAANEVQVSTAMTCVRSYTHELGRENERDSL